MLYILQYFVHTYVPACTIFGTHVTLSKYPWQVSMLKLYVAKRDHANARTRGCMKNFSSISYEERRSGYSYSRCMIQGDRLHMCGAVNIQGAPCNVTYKTTRKSR